MRVLSLVLIAIFTCITAMACSAQSSQGSIVTSAYPLEFAVRSIAPDREVVNITPVGVEPHDFELSPQNTFDILSADVVFTMGNDFQPAVEETAARRNHETYVAAEMVNDRDDDPHLWLDPVAYSEVVTGMTRVLVKKYPEKKILYEKNSTALLKRLEVLDGEYTSLLRSCETTTFITSHEAFSRLAQRYSLANSSIAGISPENEPTPEKLREITSYVEQDNISVIFTEENVSDKVARTLSREAGVTTAVLSPIESLTDEQVKEKSDYFTLMESNLQKLSRAMRCSGVEEYSTNQ